MCICTPDMNTSMKYFPLIAYSAVYYRSWHETVSILSDFHKDAEFVYFWKEHLVHSIAVSKCPEMTQCVIFALVTCLSFYAQYIICTQAEAACLKLTGPNCIEHCASWGLQRRTRQAFKHNGTCFPDSTFNYFRTPNSSTHVSQLHKIRRP